MATCFIKINARYIKIKSLALGHLKSNEIVINILKRGAFMAKATVHANICGFKHVIEGKMVGPNIVIDIVSRVKRSSKLWNTRMITEFPRSSVCRESIKG